MSVDKTAKNLNDAAAPFRAAVSITKSDSTVYDPPLRGLIVMTDGDVAIKTEKNETAVTITVKAGQLIPFIITHVMATGTTATVVGGI